MADQEGRVAVVTGGGRGLGRQVALGLASRGAKVLAVARTAEQLRETERLAQEAGGQVVGIPADVSRREEVDRLRSEVEDRGDPPTILVNAAGVFGPISLIKDSDPEAWLRTVSIDALAPYLTIRAFLPGMLDAGWGRIVNVT